ncbi:unnamed protein product, partial [Ectocarpus sp. 8 AP-2014]
MPHSLGLPGNHHGQAVAPEGSRADRLVQAPPSAAAAAAASGGVGPVVAQGKHAAAPSSTTAASGHLWVAGPSHQHQGKRPAAAAEVAAAPDTGGRPTRVPAQSPLLPVDWWCRPPSPLVSHARPLWRSSSGSYGEITPTFAAATAAEASTGLRKRARSSPPAGAAASPPSEGEAAGGGSSLFRLDPAQ